MFKNYLTHTVLLASLMAAAGVHAEGVSNSSRCPSLNGPDVPGAYKSDCANTSGLRHKDRVSNAANGDATASNYGTSSGPDRPVYNGNNLTSNGTLINGTNGTTGNGNTNAAMSVRNRTASNYGNATAPNRPGYNGSDTQGNGTLINGTNGTTGNGNTGSATGNNGS